MPDTAGVIGSCSNFDCIWAAIFSSTSVGFSEYKQRSGSIRCQTSESEKVNWSNHLTGRPFSPSLHRARVTQAESTSFRSFTMQSISYLYRFWETGDSAGRSTQFPVAGSILQTPTPSSFQSTMGPAASETGATKIDTKNKSMTAAAKRNPQDFNSLSANSIDVRRSPRPVVKIGNHDVGLKAGLG